MKPIKEAIFLLIIYFFCITSALTAKDNIPLTLPVRIFSGKQPVTHLQKQDFQLNINEQQRTILKVEEETASLSQLPDFLGRNFILSFHISEYGNQIQNALSYFVFEIINPKDSLILMTPIKLYRINVTANKGRMKTDIEDLVKRDSEEFKNRLNAAEKNLDIQLNRMKQLFRGEISDPGLVASYKIIGTFLSSFPHSFLNFRDLFLFPDMKNYQKALTFLGDREGERWWIHFQQFDCFGVVPRILQITQKIDEYCNLNTLARQSFQNNLQQLEKLLDVSGMFPVKPLLNVFYSGNIRFHSILGVYRKPKDISSTSNIIPILGTTFDTISQSTGGKTANTNDPEQGLKSIHHYRDHYYRLIYDFNGNIEEKKIDVKTIAADLKNTVISHKSLYSQEEMRSLIQYLSKKKVLIDDFSFSKNKIKFSIEDITLKENKGDSFGLVKVRIELLNPTGESVFRTENTLRSSKQKITVSIPIPHQNRGKFKLIINACDLITNRLTSFEQSVMLN